MNAYQQKIFLKKEIEKYLESSIGRVQGEEVPEALELKKLLIQVELGEKIIPSVRQYFEQKKWIVRQVGSTIYLS
ncbi:MAG: hypothetical protein HFJ37_03735 [Clostridia bacterium]|nr:hypothetical protein [Clostridia bacterium]